MDETWGASARTESYGRPAGFWIRLVAYIIDWIILFLADVVIFLIVVAMVDPGFYDVNNPVSDPSDRATTLYYLLSLFTSISYFTITISLWAGTLGHRITSIRVLRPDGSKLGPGRAFIRILAAGLSLLLLGIGFLMIAFRDDKRGLHDLICDTVVVFKR